MIERLFSQFCREKQFLNNVSPRTLKFYQDCLNAWKRTIGEDLPDKLNIKEFVIRLQESRINVVTINIYIRGINSFLTWLHENEHLRERLRIKQLREPEKVLKVFSDEQLKLLLSWKPATFYQHRLYALIALIIDTGIRIDEALSLTRENVLLEDLLIKVRGKGSKERYVPISMECRKVLYKFLNRHDFDLVFPTKDGGKIAQCNAFRDFNALCKELSITGVRTSWHTLRHGYALNHIREGGDVFSLQRILGHSDLTITKRYVGLTETDLKLIHKKTSILSRLK